MDKTQDEEKEEIEEKIMSPQAVENSWSALISGACSNVLPACLKLHHRVSWLKKSCSTKIRLDIINLSQQISP